MFLGYVFVEAFSANERFFKPASKEQQTTAAVEDVLSYRGIISKIYRRDEKILWSCWQKYSFKPFWGGLMDLSLTPVKTGFILNDTQMIREVLSRPKNPEQMLLTSYIGDYTKIQSQHRQHGIGAQVSRNVHMWVFTVVLLDLRVIQTLTRQQEKSLKLKKQIQDWSAQIPSGVSPESKASFWWRQSSSTINSTETFARTNRWLHYQLNYLIPRYPRRRCHRCLLPFLMTAWEILDLFRRGIKLLWAISPSALIESRRPRLPLKSSPDATALELKGIVSKEMERKRCWSVLEQNNPKKKDVLTRGSMCCGVQTWLEVFGQKVMSDRCFSKSEIAQNVKPLPSSGETNYFSTHTTHRFASQTSFCGEFLSEKRWVHFSAGGERRNLDKRFLLTFPAPDCQSDRSLPSLMNSGVGKKWCTGV